MQKDIFSNAMLVFGVVTLATFGVMELTGLRADPIMPAFSAFLIGATAVLDRVGVRRMN